jgi:hypothetical protein
MHVAYLNSIPCMPPISIRSPRSGLEADEGNELLEARGRGPCLGGLVEDLEGGVEEEVDQRREGAPMVSPLASASTREWNWTSTGFLTITLCLDTAREPASTVPPRFSSRSSRKLSGTMEGLCMLRDAFLNVGYIISGHFVRNMRTSPITCNLICVKYVV